MTDTDERTRALLGEAAMRRLRASHVLVVGVGGVGSWCAEALARTGVGRLTLVDDDVVVASNMNRQCPAAVSTLGRNKVDAMAARLGDVAPETSVESRFERFLSFPEPPDADLVVDAIDSVAAKAELILGATASGVPIVSSLGAALRKDPTAVTVSRFEKVSGDALARALRQRFKRLGRFPAAPFRCVWSTERPAENRVRGSIMPVTATFGMVLAAEAIDILTKSERNLDV